MVEVSSQVKVHKIIKNRPNIYYLGGKSHIELPYYLNIFDVCIIPYLRMHPQNVYCSPLKLYTYLTTGKPIVTTDLLGVHPFSDLVRIAHDVAEFEHEISMALAEGDECLERRRIEAARENSWEKQAEKILAIVKKTLRRKYGKID